MSFIFESVNDHPLRKKFKCVAIPKFINIRPIDLSHTPIGHVLKQKNCFMPNRYKYYANKIHNLEVYPTDIWIITFPKCGTTWTQEMVWLLCNDLNYEKAKSIPLNDRFPFLEMSAFLPSAVFVPLIKAVNVTKMQQPRLIKSHLPVALLPHQLWTKKPKIIYVTRNPKDAAISMYHHYYNMIGFQGTLDDFLECFMGDCVMNAPFHSHVTDFWEMRDEPNILFNSFEEMKNDLPAVIRKIATFLNKTIDDDQIRVLAEHLSFESMKKNPSVNFEEPMNFIRSVLRGRDKSYTFIRDGKIGGYKDAMSPEMIKRFDEWSKQKLSDSTFKFQL